MVPLVGRLESAEERLNLQDERLNLQSQKLEKHDEQLGLTKEDIKRLNERDREKHVRLLSVEESYERLENTVEKQNKETRATMREQTEKLFTIVEQAMGYQETRTSQSHELKMARLSTWSTVFLKVSGGIFALSSTGGAIYYFIVNVLDK